VLPSLGYENFPRLLVEAMACGRPALVSDIGALAEIVEHGRTVLRFHPGDTQGIAETLNVILADGALADRLGVNARAEYLAKYTPERNFEQLMRIYHFALTRR
jgi:glycosyltransferase involved in cell wall biosynthesis